MEKDLMDKYDLVRRMLIDARLKAGLKQAEVAAKLDKPQSYVSKIERGERGIDVIEFLEIAQAIKFDPLIFLDELVRRFA